MMKGLGIWEKKDSAKGLCGDRNHCSYVNKRELNMNDCQSGIREQKMKH
jgi:hypothetical protein